MSEADKFGGLFRRIGDTIHLGTKKFKGKAILSSKFEDDSGESLVQRMKAEEHDNFRKLDGFIVKVTGGSAATIDDYFLQYDDTNKTWTECAEPGISEG